MRGKSTHWQQAWLALINKTHDTAYLAVSVSFFGRVQRVSDFFVIGVY